MKTVAVIDVGSNTIKTLVGVRGSHGRVESLFEHTLEVRISQGISGHPPRLQPDRIAAGIDAVVTLHRDWQKHGPIDDCAIVATSAVRDAQNGEDFLGGVEEAIGIRPIILTGDEEAHFIAEGIRQDPEIGTELQQFSLADLGGGSLEIIRFAEGAIDKAVSLQLGSVRLFEAFPPDPKGRYPQSMLDELQGHARREIEQHDIVPVAPLVGTGGGMAVTRALLAGKHHTTFKEISPTIAYEDVCELVQELSALTFAERLEVPGLPPGRADIFPVALAIYQTLMEMADAQAIQQSLYNLRFGIASHLLTHGYFR
ncbi:MAG: Ppx/GppA phosphatase [Puniceicoccaceae bacterium 5H]|nr:MAG: Ppx/GppA phosphatase [Puniceicoccaceae bacterium 5H]